MADAVQTQGTGGGEGAPAAVPTVPSPQEAKPATDPAVPQDSKPAEPEKTAEQNEVKKELEASPAATVADTKKEETTPSADPAVPAVPQPAVETTVEKPATVDPVPVAPAPVEPAADLVPATPVTTTDHNANVEQSAASTESNWQQRELELLKKIEELEKVKNEKSEDGLKLELKVREEEIDLLKARVRNLETELHAALSKPSGKNHEMIENIKQQHEELLSKARGMIFDKTKMVKNQELQIEALTTQVQSLKDINQITKDLLEIRNSEVKAMEDRFQAMEARFKAEKERYSLVLQRAQTSSTINDDLKKEYETQLAIFKELREKYEQRVKALVAENERLKASVASNTTAGTSAQ